MLGPIVSTLVLAVGAGAQLAAADAATPPDTIFGSAVPATIDSGDANATELGMKFTTSTAGFVTGVRFYKAVANTGTHIGTLWTASGQLLAQATFTNETPSGWQTTNFATAIAITPGTTYVVAYYAPDGHYSVSTDGLSSADSNGPLTAIGNDTSPDGLYAEAQASTFPTNTEEASNYYVDPMFVATSSSGAAASPSPSDAATTTPSSVVYSAATGVVMGPLPAGAQVDAQGGASWIDPATGDWTMQTIAGEQPYAYNPDYINPLAPGGYTSQGWVANPNYVASAYAAAARAVAR